MTARATVTARSPVPAWVGKALLRSPSYRHREEKGRRVIRGRERGQELGWCH